MRPSALPPIPSDISAWDAKRLSEAIRDLASRSASLRLARTPRRIITAIVRASDLLLDSAETGAGTPGSLPAGAPEAYSLPMIREGLRNFRATLQDDDLARLAAATGNAPAAMLHVLAGNLFLSGLEAINSALLCGAASLVRCSSADRYFPAVWRNAIAASDPELAHLIAITWWPTDRSDLTQAAASAADWTQVFGSDESVEAVRLLTPREKRFIAHPSKISFAIITADALRSAPESVGRALAYDFSVYDQQGCLSPRAAFIEMPESAATVDRFRSALLAEMTRLYRMLPPGVVTLEDKAALARERNEALIAQSIAPTIAQQNSDEASACALDSAQLWSGASDPFVVALQHSSGYRPGCLNRFVDLRAFRDFASLEATLAPWRGKIAALGFAGDSTNSIAPLARRLQAIRICRIGEMQKPPLGWSHDGPLPITPMSEHA